MDWPGLLKWSLQYTDAETGSRRMSEEDAEFLQKAIKHALSNMVDHHKIVEESIPKLSSTDVREVLAALGLIEKCLDEHPEIARNLDKLQALEPLVKLLERTEIDILTPLLNIFIFSLGNNPAIQSTALGYGCMESLLPLIDHIDHKICAKSFGALAALVRNHRLAEQKFVVAGGLSILGNALASPRCDERVKTKAAGFLRHLLMQKVSAYNYLKQAGILSSLLNILTSDIPEVGGSVDLGENCALAVLHLCGKYWLELRNDLNKPLDQIRSVCQRRVELVVAVGNDNAEEKDARQQEEDILMLITQISSHPTLSNEQVHQLILKSGF